MRGFYKLDANRNPVPVGDDPESLADWARWNNVENRRVALTVIDDEGNNVSTVFLGLDHSYSGGRPVLFETLIFGGPYDGDMWRYHTWAEAEAGHAAAVDFCKKAIAEANHAASIAISKAGKPNDK